MNSKPPVLDSQLGERLQRLDRHPAATSALVAGALCLASSQSAAVVERWADYMFPALARVLDLWPWILAFTLVVLAFFLDRIAAGLGWVKEHLHWDATLLGYLLVLVGVLFSPVWEADPQARLVLSIAIGVFLYALRHERVTVLGATIDQLHRKFFVERIAKVIESESKLPKIAVLGSWGSGKTVILELLQSELALRGSTNWRMGWVNPWRSASPEEAWVAMAGAIDSALGNKPLFPRNWVDHPVLVWLAGLIPHANLTPELVSFFSGRSSGRTARDAVQSINRKIRAKLNHKTERLIIFVDDMERADPAVLRGLLPVIDRLHEIEECQFVFAIDPSRVADAFEEEDKNAPLAKGYLDKVFDLQIPIPEPRDADVRTMILKKANEGSTPILADALARIGDHIPTNPRLAHRFFEVAKTKELMFLQRFSSNEVPAPQFFLSWIIETEFKGFHEAIRQPDALSIFNDVCGSFWASLDRKRPSEHQKFPKLIELLAQSLLRDRKSAERHRLENLIAALADLFGHSLDRFGMFSARFSLQWIADGHTRLEELSITELKSVREAWHQSAGKISIQEMISGALDRTDYCDESRCGEQLLAAEVDDIIAATRSTIRSSAPENAFVGISARIERLNAQFDLAYSAGPTFDQQLFSETFFYRWLEFFVNTPLRSDALPAERDVARKREELHVSIAGRLPMLAALTALNHKLNREIHRPGSPEHLADLRLHEKKLREALMKRVTQGVLGMFRDGTLARRNVPSNLPINDPQFFNDPKRWVWLEDDDWKKELAQLEAESAKNRNIAEACADIAEHLFIHPAACEQCAGGHQEDREILMRVAAQTPEYLQFVWNSAMKLDPKDEGAERLLRERKRAAEAGIIEVSFLDKYFPLPPNDQSGGETAA